MFKKLQKLSVTIIALNLIFIFSMEMLSMASGYCPSFGGTWEREIPIVDELPLSWWQVEDDPSACDPISGLSGPFWDYQKLAGTTLQEEMPNMGSITVEKEKCPPGKIDYFQWWNYVLLRLSQGNFDEFCDPVTEKSVLEFIKKNNLRTPIYFDHDDDLKRFKNLYDKLKHFLKFNEKPEFQDENCFFAENLYFMACKFRNNVAKVDQVIPFHSTTDSWKVFAEINFFNPFKEMFKIIPTECLQRRMS